MCFSNVVFFHNLFCIPQRKVGFLLCWLFIKNYYDRYYDIKQTMRKKPSYFMVCLQWVLARLTPLTARERVCVCLPTSCVLLNYIILGINSPSLEIVHAKKIFSLNFFEDLLAHKHQQARNLSCISLTKCYISSKLIQTFHKSNSQLFL